MVSPRKITSDQRELCKSGFLAITPLYVIFMEYCTVEKGMRKAVSGNKARVCCHLCRPHAIESLFELHLTLGIAYCFVHVLHIHVHYHTQRIVGTIHQNVLSLNHLSTFRTLLDKKNIGVFSATDKSY